MLHHLRPSRLRGPAVICLVAVLVVLFVRLLGQERYRKQRVQIEALGAARRAEEAANYWNLFQYRPVRELRLADLLYRATLSNQVALTKFQQAKLLDRLAMVEAHLCYPNLTNYLKLKTGGLDYTFRPSQGAKYFLGRDFEFGRPGLPSDAISTVSLLWERVSKVSSNRRLTRLDALCAESIACCRTNTNSWDALLFGKVSKGFTVAAFATEPGFSYRESQDSRDELVLCWSFYAKANTSLTPGPVHLSLVWSSPDQEWRTGEMCADHWLNFRPLF